MNFKQITSKDISYFSRLVGEPYIIIDEEGMEAYSHDETEDLIYSPELVLKPGTTEEISAIVRYCNENNIPVTPMGARTGLSGGALPLYGGIALSMERFNKIIEIDTDNLQATVEPAVITQVFQEAVMEKSSVLSARPGK